MLIEQRPRLFLIDGSSYIFRAYYAIPPMSNSAGLPTNGIFGFTNFVVKFLKQNKPEYIAVALDAGPQTFRNQLFAGYKGHRPAPCADLLAQFPYFRRVLECLNVPLVELPGYEADDIIATLRRTLRSEKCDLVVVSSDKDLMQLVIDGIKLFDSAKQNWIGVPEVQSKFGVGPERITQVMGLMGDAVDNIPGVKGIGAKTATALIQQFETLENLFSRLHELDNLTLRGAARLRKILEDGKGTAFLSRDLATIRRDVPLATRLEDLRFTGFNQPKLRSLFAELEFANLIVLLDNNRL